MTTETKCSDHPDAPHGFNRNASHNSGRYVCTCEEWEPEMTTETVELPGQPTQKFGTVSDLVTALENCRLYAARHRKEEWAKTILRLCEQAGIVSSPLRSAPEHTIPYGPDVPTAPYWTLEAFLAQQGGEK